MKTIKSLFAFFLIILLGCFSSVFAQTKQFELHADFTDGAVWCLGKTLSGSWTYHVTYHINKKTGEVDNLHWNVKHCDLWDSDGNKYKAIDTGNDNLAAWWNFFNNINLYNDLEDNNIQYDEEDGWLDPDVYVDPDNPGWPTIFPQTGMMVNTFKFVGQGDKVTWKSLIQVHMNANGDLTANFIKEIVDCNE